FSEVIPKCSAWLFKTSGVSYLGFIVMETIAKSLLSENFFSTIFMFSFIIGQIVGQVEKKNSNTYTFPIKSVLLSVWLSCVVSVKDGTSAISTSPFFFFYCIGISYEHMS